MPSQHGTNKLRKSNLEQAASVNRTDNSTFSQLVSSNENENSEEIDIQETMNEESGEPAYNDEDVDKLEFDSKAKVTSGTPELKTHSESISVQQSQLRKRSSSSNGEPNEIIQKMRYQRRYPITYRKIFYDDAHHKWIEHQIYEVNNDESSETMKRKIVPKSVKRPRKPRRVKGRQTAIMRHMLPTALIKSKNDDDKIYRNIDMTDQLRMELHKRNMPVVPMYFQEHIYKFGKLPFRNNPRMH